MSWSAGTQHHSPRQAPCRGLDLAGPGSLPSSEACRSPGPAGAHIAPRRVSCDVILSLERPSRQAPLAGVSISCLVYFVLEWFYMGSVVPASSSCRGLASLARQAPLAGGPVLNVWSSLGQKGPWKLLVLPWPALPRRATTARAQVRGTKVPLL